VTDVGDEALMAGLDGFLDGVGSRTPTPGGGSVAAATGALASALGRMVCAYSPGKAGSSDDELIIREAGHRLERVESLLRASVLEDGEAYENLVASRGRMKTGAETESDYAVAVALAASVPLQIGALSAECLTALKQMLNATNPHLRSDLGVAAVLAEATVRASAYMVRVNARIMTDESSRESVLGECETLIARSAALLCDIENRLAESM
jgi:formiminotetrahydrofolate cyclodeaminase